MQDFRKNSISLKTERTASNFPLKTGKYRQKRLHSLQNYHTSDLQTGWSDKISGNQSKNCENTRKPHKKGQKWRIFIKFPAFSANQQVFRRILSGQNRIASVCPTAQKAENNASELSSKHQTGNCTLTAQQRASNTA